MSCVWGYPDLLHLSGCGPCIFLVKISLPLSSNCLLISFVLQVPLRYTRMLCSFREATPLVYYYLILTGEHLISWAVLNIRLQILAFCLKSVLCCSFSLSPSLTVSYLLDGHLFPFESHFHISVNPRPGLVLYFGNGYLQSISRSIKTTCRLEDQSHSEPKAQSYGARIKMQPSLLPVDQYTSPRLPRRRANLVSCERA